MDPRRLRVHGGRIDDHHGQPRRPAPLATAFFGGGRARAVLGVAGAAIAPCTLALISTMFPNARQRATAIGVWAGCFTIGAVVGPIVGGVLLSHFWWGSAFLIGVPAMAVLLAVGPFLLPEYRDERA